jgi:nickel-type superoxide dismutase maturation protease
LPVERLEITGESMIPTLQPGDRVLVFRGVGPLTATIRVGDLVAFGDPRRPERTMVKRVAGFAAGGIVVHGDNAAASTDSRHFGPVDPRAVRGRVVYRYHPEARRGRPGTRW